MSNFERFFLCREIIYYPVNDFRGFTLYTERKIKGVNLLI